MAGAPPPWRAARGRGAHLGQAMRLWDEERESWAELGQPPALPES